MIAQNENEPRRQVESLSAQDPTSQPDWVPLSPLPALSASAQDPYPFECMGEVLGAAAASISSNLPAPDSLVAGAVLAAASLAVQPHYCIRMPDSCIAPLSLFVATTAGGEDCLEMVCDATFRPIFEHRAKQARQFARDELDYQNSRMSRSREGDAFQRPIDRPMFLGNGTAETLGDLLSMQPCASLFSGDGSAFLHLHSLGEDRRTKYTSLLVQAWHGGPIDFRHKGSGLHTLLGRRLSLHLPVRTGLLTQLLSDPLMQGGEFLACCLVSEPPSLAGTREFRPGNVVSAEQVMGFHKQIASFLCRPVPLRLGGDNCELEPAVICLSPDATATWLQFKNTLEVHQAEGGGFSGVRAFATRAPNNAARFAAIVQLFNDPEAEQVTAEAMSGGIGLMNFYLRDRVRITAAGVESGELAHLHLLESWMRSMRSPLPHADILQRSPFQLRKRKAAGLYCMLTELEQRGYVRRVGADWEVRPTQSAPIDAVANSRSDMDSLTERVLVPRGT